MVQANDTRTARRSLSCVFATVKTPALLSYTGNTDNTHNRTPNPQNLEHLLGLGNKTNANSSDNTNNIISSG